MKATNQKPINTCPLCGEVKSLCLIKSSDGREWINSACRPCNMAMDESDRWKLYVGGIK